MSLAAGTASGGDAQGDTLSNIENLTGSGFTDTLEGDGGNNVLNGGAGIDTVSYEHAGAAVAVSLAITAAQNTGGAGTDTLSGFENLTGSAFNDTLTGQRLQTCSWALPETNAQWRCGCRHIDWRCRERHSRWREWARYSHRRVGSRTDLFSVRLQIAHRARRLVTTSYMGSDMIDLSAIDANTSLSGDQAFAFSGQNPMSLPVVSRGLRAGGNTIIQADVNGNTTADFDDHIDRHQSTICRQQIFIL